MSNIKDFIPMNNINNLRDNVLNQDSSRDIAIIGMSAKLPGVDSIHEFWDKIANGTDFICTIPEERKQDVVKYFNFIGSPKTEKDFEEGAYLKSIDKFDYTFFNISPNDAAFMDPNQRLFLETAWETIEDAGYNVNAIKGSDTAVFVGLSNEADYKKMIYDVVEPSFYPMTVQGNLTPFIASRISYLLDLRGPSMIVNTLCSSSLVALHLGCQALRNGECSMALIGGVQINLIPIRQVEVGIESSSKRTRTFDHLSDGTGTGEGVIAILIKPLDKALEDGDNIYAVIKGSAYNQDGASAGLTAPNPTAQEDVIVKAWQDAGIDPETIAYIEAHGTGTKIGDPIEIDGIQRAFRRYTDKKQFCAIGSVKSNIGHLDASAGLAGLLKAVLAMQNKQIPPTIHFDRPNRLIAFHESPVYVNTKLRTWETDNHPRRCGVSSFGFSGTNCHVVLEEPPYLDSGKNRRVIKDEELRILPLSAKTVDALERLVMHYSKLDYDELGWENVCYSASTKRSHYNCRLAIIVEGKKDLLKKLGFIMQMGLKGISKIGIYYNGIFYNEHKVINENKGLRDHGAITRQEKKNIDQNALEILKSINAKDDFTGDMLVKICDLYVRGAEIQWDVLYQFDNMNKVRLPVYPFERKRCWVTIPESDKYNPEELFYTKRWYRKGLDKSSVKKEKGTILVINNTSIGQTLAKKSGLRVIEAIVSNEYRQLDKDVYSIRNKEDDFIRLLDAIGINNITQIVYSVFSDEEDGKDLSDFELKYKKVLYSFFHMAKKIMEYKLNNSIDIVLIGQCASSIDGSEKTINPEYGALFGLGKVVNVEASHIKCRYIDIDDSTEVSDILDEIELGQDYTVAYRKGSRYVQEIASINPTMYKNRNVQIKDGGVYVITGGMGGIGLNIASYLSLQAKVRIILLNRTEYPDRKNWDFIKEHNRLVADKLKTVLEIEERGSSVEIDKVDITRYEELKEVLRSIRSKYGKIDGIIHSAAIGVGLQGKTLKEENLENFIHVISPKMHGTYLLDELTKEDNLDFFVVFSSPITLMGAIGSGSYTAANAYIESFSQARSLINKNTICINWAPWEKSVSKENFMENKQMFELLSTEELIRSFDLIMDKDLNSVIVGKLKYNSDFFKLKDILPFDLSDNIKSKISTLGENKKTESALSLDNKQKNLILKGREDGAYSKNEKFIATIWGDTLGYTKLSIDDNFYELGGDSISAMKIVNRINAEKNMELNVKDLLSNLTIREMAVCMDKKQSKYNNLQYSLIPNAEKKEYYEASMAQKRMYLLTIRKHRDISWNMSWIFHLKGTFDVNKLEQTFKSLIDRHEILRTSFCIIKGEIVQKIENCIDFSIVKQDLDNKPINQVAEEFIKPFKLDKAPLFRVGLFKANDEEHFLIFDIHHLIADAASMQVMLQDIRSIYKGIELPDLPIQYKDYSEWQNSLLTSGYFKKQKEYWMNKLMDVSVLKLPLDNVNGEELSTDGNKLYAEISEDLTSKLKSLSEKTGVSLFVSLVSAFFILISKFSTQNDITIGTPISGRTHKDLEKLIGVFINIIVLKCKLKNEMTYVDLLRVVSQDFLESCDNCDYPFFELVKDVNSYFGSDKNPISNILFVMQNTGSQELELESGLSITPCKHVNLVSRNDILLEAVERDNKIQLIFEYNTKLFRKEAIEDLINLYQNIIKDVCRDCNIRIGDL